MAEPIVFDPELIRRYDVAGPRYTSYPTAVQFTDEYDEAAYRRQLADSNRGRRPLSLYVHLPFCDTVCFYCACNKIVTKNRARAAPYVSHLVREVELQGGLIDATRVVEQLHWGGGTPTFLSHDEMRTVMDATRRHFRLRDDDGGQYSIEVDPREIRAGTLPLLRELGFNRLSMGVQDFDPAVQKAVNRLQSPELTFAVLGEARALGFRSVNMDLIYGLPLQTVDSFARTLASVIAAAPDRLSIFNYAHLPKMFKTQRQIDESQLPSAQTRLDILQRTNEMLIAAGYVYIGMDHFARPDDELAVAQAQGTLYRNFQGYSTHADCDLIGLGITSIGAIQGRDAAGRVTAGYAQNVKTIDEYYARIDARRLAVFRGIALSDDDRLRRDVIVALICHFALDVQAIEQAHGIVFGEYFAAELQALAALAADGLVRVDARRITVLPPGRFLIRNICMVFDRYLRERQGQRFSRVI
ncbi:MAG: oxygen-independent coproporphyrinogen III oxidase [Pseudomonadota bacterium]|mgnify:FL=1